MTTKITKGGVWSGVERGVWSDKYPDIVALKVDKCNLNAMDGDWCTHYAVKCFINCEYSGREILKKY